MHISKSREVPPLTHEYSFGATSDLQYLPLSSSSSLPSPCSAWRIVYLAIIISFFWLLDNLPSPFTKEALLFLDDILSPPYIYYSFVLSPPFIFIQFWSLLAKIPY